GEADPEGTEEAGDAGDDAGDDDGLDDLDEAGLVVAEGPIEATDDDGDGYERGEYGAGGAVAESREDVVPGHGAGAAGAGRERGKAEQNEKCEQAGAGAHEKSSGGVGGR